MSNQVEYGLGQIITLQPKGIQVQVIEEHCDQCYFSPHYPLPCYQMNCSGTTRSDGKYICFKQVDNNGTQNS